MIIRVFHEKVAASIICHMQLCKQGYHVHFIYKAAVSHGSLVTPFWVSTFLQSSVYMHNLMFLFVKGNRVEEG